MGRRLRALGYARVSKPKKRRDGTVVYDSLSIEAQSEAIRRAAEYHDWDLIGIKADNGKTGANTRRDGLREVRAMLRASEADILVVAKYDRLSRDVVDFSTLLKQAERQGWFLSVLDQRVDTSTAMGWYMAHQMALTAEFERRMTGERTRDALAVLKDNGVSLGRPSDISADVRKKVKRWHGQGMSATAIARRLTEEGIPTQTGKAAWHHSVIVDLLKREAVRS